MPLNPRLQPWQGCALLLRWYKNLNNNVFHRNLCYFGFSKIKIQIIITLSKCL